MRRKINFSTLLLFILIVSSSCGGRESSVPTIELKPVKSIDRFGEEVFVSDYIKSIISYKDCFYFLDKKASVVIRTDKDLNYKATYGRRGRGSGETIFVESFGVGFGKVYLDGSLCSYNVFDIETADYIRSIDYQANIGQMPVSQRILIDRDLIIAGYNGEYTLNETPIVAMDSSGNFVGAYKGTAIGSNPTTKAHTERDIFKTIGGGYLSLVKNSPVIDLYDEHLNYRRSIDLSGIEIVKSRMKQIERLKNRDCNRNTVHFLFNDSYYSQGSLYVLCYSERSGTDNQVQCNTVMKLDLSTDHYIHSADYILPDLWYGSICVDPDGKTLIAANTLGSVIDVFDLD